MSNTTEHALYYRYLRGRAGDLLERDQSQSLTLAEQTAHALGMTTRGLGMLSSYDVALKVASMLDQKVAGGSRSPEEFFAPQLAVESRYTPPSRDGVGEVTVTEGESKGIYCTSTAACPFGRSAGPYVHYEGCPYAFKANVPQSSAAPEPATAAATTTEPWRPLAAMHGKAHRVLAEVERSLVELRDLESKLDRAWQDAAGISEQALPKAGA